MKTPPPRAEGKRKASAWLDRNGPVSGWHGEPFTASFRQRPLTFMKSALLEHIRLELNHRLERLTKAALAAHAAATDPDSKAESKYDTRTLEAGYLASGQARKVKELSDDLAVLDAFEPPLFEPDASIEAGALVEVEMNGETMHFLLTPVAGGMEIVHEEVEITLLSPASSLYQKLVGLRAGDSIPTPRLSVTMVS